MTPHDTTSLNRLAVGATVHCLTGCAIGERLAMVTGAALHLGNGSTIALSIGLAFVFGYGAASRRHSRLARNGCAPSSWCAPASVKR